MSPIEVLIRSALIPSLIVGGFFVFESLFHRGPMRTSVQAGAVLMAFAVGYLGVGGEVNFPPVDARQWVFWVSLIGTLWAFPNGRGLDGAGSSFFLIWVPRLLLVFAISTSMLRPFWSAVWAPTDIGSHGLGLALVSGTLWYSLERGFARSQQVALGSTLVSLTGFSVVCLLSGSAWVSQTIGVLCAVMGTLLVWNLVMVKHRASWQPSAFLFLSIWSLFLNAYYFVDAQWNHLALVFAPIFLAPLVMGLASRHARLANPLFSLALALMLSIPFVAAAVYFAYTTHGLPY